MLLVAEHEALQPQAADLLHLLDPASPLLGVRVPQTLSQLLDDARPVVHPRTHHEREAEPRFVLSVEARHTRDLRGAQAVQPGGTLLLARLRGQGATLQVLTREVRVAPEDAFFTCREEHGVGLFRFTSSFPIE